MSFKVFKLIFKQLTPICIGKRKCGLLNETLTYIPGKTMWGALVKLYNLYKGESLGENQDLFKNITCFIPALKISGSRDMRILLPSFKEGDFYLGNLKEDEFRFLFVDSFISTAIIPEFRAAKEESLHELEFILPRPRGDVFKSMKNVENKYVLPSENIYWMGYIFAKKEEEEEFIKILKNNHLKLFIGSDIKYGYGLLTLEDFEEKNNLESVYLSTLNDLEIVEINNIDGNMKKIKFNFLCPIIKNNNIKITKGKLKLHHLINFYGKDKIYVKESKWVFSIGTEILYKNIDENKEVKINKGTLEI